MRTTDIDQALSLYESIADGGDDERMVYLVFLGDPVSKSRARFAKSGHVYPAKGQVEAELTLGVAIRQAFQGTEPFRGNVAIGCIFYRSSHQRIDVDNMLKHVLDSANGVAWIDDHQVTAIRGSIEYDPDHPRTIIVIGRHQSTMVIDRTITGVCEVCGTGFEHPEWRKKKQRFCSPACNARSRGQDLSEPIECKQCHELFKRRNSYQVLCSEDCRVNWLSGRNREEAQYNFCMDCSIQLARTGLTGAKRCRSCWKKARKAGLA